jgi:hypothetical protein
MNSLTEFQLRAAEVAVAKLLRSDTFYTCDVRKIAELLGRPLGGADWLAMQPLHCVKWGDLDPQFRRMLQEKVLEVLGMSPDIVDVVASEKPESKEPPTQLKKVGFWKKW